MAQPLMALSVKGLKRIRQKTKASGRAVEVATAKSLTFTAERAQKRVTVLIPQVFDRPTPFTRRAIRKTTATVRRPFADVFVKDLSATRDHYLIPQVRGGTRPQKRAEKRIGGYWVPGKDAKRNRYGNLTAGTWSKILADIGRFGLFTGDASNTLTRAQGGTRKIQYFMRRHKNGMRIIYKKTGKKKIVPWLVEVSRPRYRRRLPFYQAIETTWRQQYARLFAKQLEREQAKLAGPS